MFDNVKKILTYGIGEEGGFYKSHPFLNLIYFVVVIGTTMFSNHPVFLFVSFITAWLYSVLLNGKKAICFNSIVIFPIILITVFMNAINVHSGETVLFSVKAYSITKEAVVFGFIQGIMLSSAIIWFSCFNAVVTEDKMIYMFGRIAPVIALTLSMILRFIPLFKKRFREVYDAQRCMGRNGARRGMVDRIRRFGKTISILIAWSLEASIESADSMEAKGYGLRGRTSFHLFRLKRKELVHLALMVVLGAVCIVACAMNYTNIYYYPTIQIQPVSVMQGIAMVSFCLLMYTAVIMDIRGRK